MVDPVENRLIQRNRLLEAILPHVSFDGWTDSALEAGIADAGMDGLAIDRLFPGGSIEIVEYFSSWSDKKMLDALLSQNLDDLRLRERVSLAIKLRLKVLSAHRETVRRTAAFSALPGNILRAGRSVYQTVDTIWYAVGDQSADFSFYTKRALLAAVIMSTSLFWLDDESEDSLATWDFLDRRISDVMKISSLRSRVKKIPCRLPDPFSLFRRIRAR